MRNILDLKSIMKVLGDYPLFVNFGSEALEWLAAMTEVEAFAAEERICQRGEHANKLYVISSGRVALQLYPKEGITFTVDIIGPGGIYGWSSLVSPHIHTLTAVCLETVEAISINGSELRYLLEKDIPHGYHFYQALATMLGNRLRTVYQRMAE